MIVGFLTENFHTEVLEYLFQLHQNDTIILYNNCDRYDNINIYKKMYQNITVKKLNEFIYDLTNDIFTKAYLTSFDNIIVPELLTKYTHKLIYIGHSPGHIQLFAKLRLQFVSLTPLLRVKNLVNFMLPICGENTKAIKGKRDSLCLIGLFKKDNKNIELIDNLLENGIHLTLFTMLETELVKAYNTKYENFKVHVGKTTEETLQIIKTDEIGFLLFAPNEPSDYTRNKWSGSIAFAYNNGIPLVVSKEIKDIYELEGVVSYDSNDAIELIQNCNSYYEREDEERTKVRAFQDKVYERNVLLKSVIFNSIPEKNVVCTMSEHGGIFVLNNDIIGGKLLKGDYHEKILIKQVHDLLDQSRETVIVDVGSNIGTTVLGFLDTNPKCKVISFEAQGFLAKLQKKTMILNNVTKRVKIYNNAIGHTCLENITLSGKFCSIDSLQSTNAPIDYTDTKVRNFGGLSLGEGGETIDMLSIDSLQLPKVDAIKADVEGAEPLVIYGARKTIQKYKPIIVYEKNWKSITPDMEKSLGLNDTLKFFDIEKFLVSVGYDQSKLSIIDDNYIWVY